MININTVQYNNLFELSGGVHECRYITKETIHGSQILYIKLNSKYNRYILSLKIGAT